MEQKARQYRITLWGCETQISVYIVSDCDEREKLIEIKHVTTLEEAFEWVREQEGAKT